MDGTCVRCVAWVVRVRVCMQCGICICVRVYSVSGACVRVCSMGSACGGCVVWVVHVRVCSVRGACVRGV